MQTAMLTRASPSFPAEMEAFLIPGVFGDEPQLQHLRRRLRGSMRFEVLTLPDSGARGAVLTDMVATARLLVDDIASRQPSGGIALVGFSFGASLALQVAVQLVDAGREITFLGILDGPFDPSEVMARIAPTTVLSAPRKLLRSIAVDAAGSVDVLRRAVTNAAASEATAHERTEALRRAMLWHLRNKALKGWTPRPCPAPGLYVCSGEYGPANRARWAGLCPNLVRVDVPAIHEHLLKDDALEGVLLALAEAARDAAARRDQGGRSSVRSAPR